MSENNIIGITGKKSNGKDTLGDYLVSRYRYKRIGFADALKEACRQIFNFTDEQLYGLEKETTDPFWGITPRKVLQFVGTDLFREQIEKIIPHIGKDIWVETVKQKICNELSKDKTAKFVVTDVRFPNEVDMVRELGGIIIRVKRESVNKKIDEHPSEKEIDNLDVTFELENNGTISDLYDKYDGLKIN